MEEAPSTKKSKTKENKAKHVRNEAGHGQKLGARTVHPRPGTAGRPEKWHGLAVPGWAVSGAARFRAFH